MSVRGSVLALLPLALLAGCGGEPPKEDGNAQEPAIRTGPMLGTIDLSKPLRLEDREGSGWSMDLAPGRILYRPKDATPIPFYPVSPRMAGDQASYPTQTPDGEKVVITLRPERCGEGDRASPLSATLTIGARSYAGCASPLPIEQIRYDLYNEAMSGGG